MSVSHEIQVRRSQHSTLHRGSSGGPTTVRGQHSEIQPYRYVREVLVQANIIPVFMQNSKQLNISSFAFFLANGLL